MDDIARVKLKKKHKHGAWECGAFMVPQAITDEETDDGSVAVEPKQAPSFPMAIVIVSHADGIILRYAMTKPSEHYMDDLLGAFVEHMKKAGVPAQIFVQDARTHALLVGISEQLGIQLSREEHLPLLTEIEDQLVDAAETGNQEDAESMLEEMIKTAPASELPEAMVRQLRELLEASVLTGPVEEEVRRYLAAGRNDPCPCGSGKKYKHCCGKIN
ncbi:MAG: hypothetical protein GX592_02100 [Clostridiales bacterium]|nr:hypothetical protein [Clostridiales bacterium]